MFNFYCDRKITNVKTTSKLQPFQPMYKQRSDNSEIYVSRVYDATYVIILRVKNPELRAIRVGRVNLRVSNALGSSVQLTTKYKKHLCKEINTNEKKLRTTYRFREQSSSGRDCLIERNKKKYSELNAASSMECVCLL